MTTTLNVAGVDPTTSDVVVAETVAVAPAIVMGICVDLPLAVAVIVAVRVATLVVPDENVTTALPVASLVKDEAESTPVSAEKETGTPETTAFDALVTVAVMVVVVLLSDATLVCVALRLIPTAVGAEATGVVAVGVVELPDPPPPHALNSASMAPIQSDESARDERVLNMVLLLQMGNGKAPIVASAAAGRRLEMPRETVSN